MGQSYHIIYVVALAGCVTMAPMDPMNKETDPRFVNNTLWEDTPKAKPTAVVLMLHGLNLKPGKMDDWAQLLSTHNALVMRFALHGHGGDSFDIREAEAQIWREQFNSALKKAHQRAQDLDVPLYFVGFSLGALVALEHQAQNNLYKINKMVLIAPAIATPWYSQAASTLLSVFSKKFSLPSRSPKNYRANKSTSVAAYEALFELKRSLENNKFKNSNIPVLVIIDKYDELVPSNNIKNIIHKHALGNWQLQIVNNQFAKQNYGFRHLMVDQESVGPELWRELGEQVLGYFSL